MSGNEQSAGNQQEILQSLLRGGLLAGNVKMRPPRARVAPYWEDSVSFAKRDTHWSVCKLYIRVPTLQYPEAGLFILVQSGNGYVSVRVSPDDLRTLSDWFSNTLPTAITKLQELAPQEAMVKSALQSYMAAQQAGLMGGENYEQA